MDTKRIFASRLSELRKERKMTQGDVADAISVSRQSITLYERENRVPDIDVLARMSAYFGVTSDYLIGLSDARTPEAADISARTGLSGAAVEVLAFMHKHDENESICAAYFALCELLEGFAAPRTEEEFADWLCCAFPLSEKQKNEYEYYRSLSGRCTQNSKILALLGELYHFPFWEDEELVMSPHLGITKLRGGAREIISRSEKTEDNLSEIAWNTAKKYDQNMMVIPLAEFADEHTIRKISDELRKICKQHRPDAHNLEKQCMEEAIAAVEEWEAQEKQKEDQHAKEN